jgi:tetratricopeptide (TPR) repeat protein
LSNGDAFDTVEVMSLMEASQQAIGAMVGEGERHLRRREYRHALLLFETILKQAPSTSAAWLGAGEAALELGLGERALGLLSEAKEFYNDEERERWVDLKSEALRRFGSSEDGIAFVAQWLDKVEAGTRTRLLVRRAAFHLLQRDIPAAQATAQEAWETRAAANSAAIPSIANVAFGSGLTGIASHAGREMTRSGHALTGFFVLLSSMFWGAHALFVRVPVFLSLCALALVPPLRSVFVAMVALLAVGLLVTWQRMRPFALSYAVPLVFALAAYGLGLAMRIRPLGDATGIAIILFMVAGAAVAFWRGRKGRPKRIP